MESTRAWLKESRTGAIDTRLLLKQLQSELGVSYLFVTHNIGVVEYVADQVAVMNRRRIAQVGSARDVLERPQSEFTRALLAAVPRI